MQVEIAFTFAFVANNGRNILGFPGSQRLSWVVFTPQHPRPTSRQANSTPFSIERTKSGGDKLRLRSGGGLMPGDGLRPGSELRPGGGLRPGVVLRPGGELRPGDELRRSPARRSNVDARCMLEAPLQSACESPGRPGTPDCTGDEARCAPGQKRPPPLACDGDEALVSCRSQLPAGTARVRCMR